MSFLKNLLLSAPFFTMPGSARFHNSHIMEDKSGLWNGEKVTYGAATGVLGWNPMMDVVGAGVYGGIVKRDADTGKIALGYEWPENNGDWSQGPHNRVARQGKQSPFLDFTRYTSSNRGYAKISNLVTGGDAAGLTRLFNKLGDDKVKRKKLANLVMAGGARPLHMAGMTRGGDPAAIVRILVDEGADPNAMDNYGMTPLDRMISNRVAAGELKSLGGTERGPMTSDVIPAWDSDEFAYQGGIGEWEK